MNRQMSAAIIPDNEAADRGQKLWERMLEYRQAAKLSLTRAKLAMASYKETEGLTPALKRARAFEKIANGIPIYIEDDDLLAGAFATNPMYFEWYPEFAVSQDMLSQPLEGLLAEGDTEEDIADIIDYFRDKCLRGSFFARITEEDRKIVDEVCEDGAWVYSTKVQMDVDRGYHTINYEKVVKKGFLGVLEDVEAELRATPIRDQASYMKVNFLQGLAIVLKAGMEYAKRHAALARELADKANGSRKQELLKLAATCEWVPANPARTFYEAIQAVWCLHALTYLESRAPIALGRMDQYLYPYYRVDIDAGRLNREEAVEILECLRVKMSTLRLFNADLLHEIVSGEAQYHNVTLGGQTSGGKDATNELSYLFLEAASKTRSPHPTLSIRYHDKGSTDFYLKGLELVKLGLGYPAFFSDSGSIAWLLEQGVPLETARNYCLSGCVHHTIAGQSSPLEVLFFNLPKCLELALHDGVDPRTGLDLGPKTGGFDDLETFDDLLDSFKTQVKFFSEQGSDIINQQRVSRVEIAPTMLSSAFYDDCIQNGESCLGSGARYPLLGQACVGMIDTVDSLTAIKKRVYEEGSISKQELLEALSANFEGKDELRRSLMDVPKYGNDNDYVDSLAGELYDWWRKMSSEIDAPYGLKYLPTPYSVAVHGAAGKRVGALPTGRLAEQALADGSVSPSAGADANGPTAVLNSAGKIDQTPLFGTLLNMKFHPSSLRTQEDLRKLLALIKTYFGYGGKHVQFNVVDSRDLREAQANPELHRNLIVRVAGFSAFFCELHRNIQDEIINRTELTMN